MKERGKKKFDKDLIRNLRRDYKLFGEDKMKGIGYRSKPDMIAVKNNTALIIETKSESESKSSACLTYRDDLVKKKPNQCFKKKNPHPEYKTFLAWRAYCYKLEKRDIAIWMVHINLQALFYPIFFQKPGDKKKGGWRMLEDTDNEKLESCVRIPTLAFPERYKENVQDALKMMRIAIYQNTFLELDSEQLLLKLDTRLKMVELVPHVVIA